MTVLPAHRQTDVTIEKQSLASIYDDVAAPDSRKVQVTTTNARVTLQGEVASQEDRKVLQDDVEEVPGVVAVEDDLKVIGDGSAGVVISPHAIRHRVIESIFWDPRVDAAKITVEANPGGEVTLSGPVDTRDQARAAEDDAVRAGAAKVINRLWVAGSAPSGP